MSKNIVKKIGVEYFKTISNMLTSAFGLVAALAWNELIKALIARYISKGDTIKSNLVYALSVTVLAVMVTTYLASMAKKIDKDNLEGKKEKK